jgi:hypothetical protein
MRARGEEGGVIQWLWLLELKLVREKSILNWVVVGIRISILIEWLYIKWVIVNNTDWAYDPPQYKIIVERPILNSPL